MSFKALMVFVSVISLLVSCAPKDHKLSPAKQYWNNESFESKVKKHASLSVYGVSRISESLKIIESGFSIKKEVDEDSFLNFTGLSKTKQDAILAEQKRNCRLSKVLSKNSNELHVLVQSGDNCKVEREYQESSVSSPFALQNITFADHLRFTKNNENFDLSYISNGLNLKYVVIDENDKKPMSTTNYSEDRSLNLEFTGMDGDNKIYYLDYQVYSNPNQPFTYNSDNTRDTRTTFLYEDVKTIFSYQAEVSVNGEGKVTALTIKKMNISIAYNKKLIRNKKSFDEMIFETKTARTFYLKKTQEEWTVSSCGEFTGTLLGASYEVNEGRRPKGLTGYKYADLAMSPRDGIYFLGKNRRTKDESGATKTVQELFKLYPAPVGGCLLQPKKGPSAINQVKYDQLFMPMGKN